MGFNKRFLNKEIILNTPEHDMGGLFKSDAFIFLDEWSSKFYNYHRQGYIKDDIIHLLENTITT
jgi:hypothetical protein